MSGMAGWSDPAMWIAAMEVHDDPLKLRIVV